MQNENKTYQYLSIVLAIVAIVFAFLYFTKPSDKVSKTFNDISNDAEMCSVKVETWQKQYGASPTTTDEIRNEFAKILKDCSDVFKDSQDKI